MGSSLNCLWSTRKALKVWSTHNVFDLKFNKGESLSTHLNSMKSLVIQLARIKIDLDEDIVIVVLLKSLLDEEYRTIVMALTNLPMYSLVDIESSLLEEERKIKQGNTTFNERGAYLARQKKSFKGHNQ